MNRLLAIAILFISSGFSSIHAQLRLPSILSSGMVLQQNDSVSLWGWAAPAEKILVTASWSSRADSTITGNGARWKMKIKTPAAGGPFTISIVAASGNITLRNVMIGEVWVCSGQSNMEWSYNHGEKDTRTEMATAGNNNIRFFQVPKITAENPQDDIHAQWTPCDSSTIKGFSAVAYFFGKKLQQQLNVPIGLINSSWGGTPAEVWTPAELVEKDSTLQEAAQKLEPAAWWPEKAGYCYNAMIAPLTPFNIAGAIWYQGESNTKTNSTYTKLFTTLIDGWRSAWKKELPFYYVQIAPYKYGNENIGALLQEAQTRAMQHPNTGMVVVTDLVDSVTNIHPSHKRMVGDRLANWALAQTYQKPKIVYRNPAYKSARIEKNTLVVTFSNANNGLRSTGSAVSGFYISGATEHWVPAQANLEKGKIVLSNAALKDPLYIRYGFGNTMIGSVSSAEGLPLIPFRTDTWAVDQSPVK